MLEGAGAGVELEELRHEKELQREEIQKLQAQIQSLRTEIQVHTHTKQNDKIYSLKCRFYLYIVRTDADQGWAIFEVI